MIDFSLCLEGSLSVPLCDPSSEEISPKAWLLLSQSCPEALLPPWFWGGRFDFSTWPFFFGKNWSLDFWGYPCCIFFGTMKGCSLLIECEAILADLFLREGKYQWCGPTKVIKPRCTCLIGLIWGNTIPKTMLSQSRYWEIPVTWAFVSSVLVPAFSDKIRTSY